MSNRLKILREGELRGFQKVPGKWRCLGCASMLEGEERPACSCGGAVVGLSWVVYGNEGWERLRTAKADALALVTAAHRRADRLTLWVRLLGALALVEAVGLFLLAR